MQPAPLTSLAKERIRSLGKDLQQALGAVLDGIRGPDSGPVALAASTGMNPAFASRLMKALRQEDPAAVVYHLPGPEPLRRFVDAAAAAGVPRHICALAERAIADLQHCIRVEAGGRSSLHAVVASWLPEHEAGFALARKQEMFRAWSQLKGAAVRLNLATAMLLPSAQPGRYDVVWIMGLLGLRRTRPGATVKLATRRLAGAGDSARAPDPQALRDFCSGTPASVEARRVGDTMHYLLGGRGVGLGTAADLLFAEVNRGEVRYGRPPGSPPRRSHVFAEIATPCRALVFDLFVHPELFPGQQPALRIYDTAFDGVADVNDPARDVDLLDLPESVAALDSRPAAWRIPEMPRYAELIAHVAAGVGADAARLRPWRCRIEYPPYAAQVVLAFDAPERAEAPPR